MRAGTQRVSRSRSHGQDAGCHAPALPDRSRALRSGLGWTGGVPRLDRGMAANRLQLDPAVSVLQKLGAAPILKGKHRSFQVRPPGLRGQPVKPQHDGDGQLSNDRPSVVALAFIPVITGYSVFQKIRVVAPEQVALQPMPPLTRPVQRHQVGEVIGSHTHPPVFPINEIDAPLVRRIGEQNVAAVQVAVNQGDVGCTGEAPAPLLPRLRP